MARIIVMIVCLGAALMLQAQTARWMVRPTMDKIQLDARNKVYIGTCGDSTFVWNLEGKAIVQTKAHVTPFEGGYCLHVDPSDYGVYGFTSADGTYKRLPMNGDRCRYTVDRNYPYFSHGLLLVYDTDDGLYHYVKRNGTVSEVGYIQAYPFLNRHASVVAYSDPVKKKGQVAKLITTRYEDVEMTQNGKPVKVGKYDFISSVTGNKQAVCIEGKNVYLFDGNNDDCNRYSIDNSDNKSTFVQMLDSKWQPIPNEKGGFSIETTKGKMVFNRNGQLVEASWMKPKEAAKDNKKTMETSLQVRTENGKYGIDWNQHGDVLPVLPGQFDRVGDLAANLAVVELNGKMGIIAVNDLYSIKVDVNQDKPLTFTSATASTTLSVSFPFKVQRSDLEEVISVGKNVCEINPASIMENNVSNGSKFTFVATAHVPEVFSQSGKGNYSFTVKYQGLTSSICTDAVSVQYIPDYTLDVKKPMVIKDTISFYVEIPDRVTLEYNLDMTSETSMSYDVERVGNNLFNVKMYDISAEETGLCMKVTEKGCPQTEFRYTLKYVAPSRRMRGQATITPVVETTEQ